MKLEDIILVKENMKGSVMNYLSTLDDFMLIHTGLKTDSIVMSSQIALDLAKTLTDEWKWSIVEFSEYKRIEARFCTSEAQLRGFLDGRFDNPEQKTVFAEQLCNAYCLDKVARLGIRLDGSINGKIQFTYKAVERKYVQGDILHNFNGSDYRVMEKFSARNLLLMDVNKGNMLVAIGTGTYTRYPKDEIPMEDNQTIAIEWDHGVYLGATPSGIDFGLLREKYGVVREVENLSDFRTQQSDIFLFYKKIVESPLLETSVKEAAMNVMYDIFMTGREEVFRENLDSGKYDQRFLGTEDLHKEKVR